MKKNAKSLGYHGELANANKECAQVIRAPSKETLPKFIRIGATRSYGEHYPDKIRELVKEKYLRVYAFVDGLRAVPCPRVRTKEVPIEQPPPASHTIEIVGDNSGFRVTARDGGAYYEGPGYTLPGYWEVLNDPASESWDGSLAHFFRNPNEPCSIGHLSREIPLPELPHSDSLILVDDLRVTFEDLYVQSADVLDQALDGRTKEQRMRWAVNEVEFLRGVIKLLAEDRLGSAYRAVSTGRLKARELVRAVDNLPPSWWSDGMNRLSEKKCEEILSDCIKGNPRKK